MRNHWISIIALPALVLASCGVSQTIGQNENPASPPRETLSAPLPDSQPTITEQPAISQSPIPTTPDVQLSDTENPTFVPREIIERTKADLVKQFGVNASQIRVMETKAVTWPDSSLGCPQPDMAYAQIITPGYWVLLEAKEQQYPYHTDQNEQIILCLRDPSDLESGLPLPVIPVNPNEIDDGQPWVPVD
jgi:hypothetical protein